MVGTASSHEVHLRDYLYILRKRRVMIALFLAACVGGGVFFTLFERVIYRATATILIERENPNIVDFKEVMSFDASSTDYYQTQHLMIKSESLIRRLLEAAGMMEDPYFLGLRRGFLRRYLKDAPFLPPWAQRFVMEPSAEQLFVRRMLDIDPVRNSRLVRVSVAHPRPERAAELANRLVELFIERNLESRFLIATQATELISRQLGELKEKVAVAEERLQDYKEVHGLSRIPSIREQDEFLQEAKLTLVKIQSQESRLAKRYLPDHPRRIHIRSQIEGLEQKIGEEEDKRLALGRTAIDYGQLEREAESARKTYEALLGRLEETTSEAKMQASNVLVVDRALTPPRPYKPRPVLNVLVAFFIGALGGVILAFFAEYLDSTIKVPEDVEKWIGLDLLGIIPQAPRNPKGLLQGEIFFDPSEPSVASESFRALRTALLFRFRHVPGCRSILVTSPNPEEGKTTVSLNLAAAFQQNHLKVLLVDGDLRKPRLHQILGVASAQGLSNILEGEASEEKILHHNAANLGLDFLASGAASRHPTEILGSDAMRDLMQRLRKFYDIILIDSPPYLAVADVVVLSEYADSLLIATRYHKTDRRHLAGVRKRFPGLDSKVFGAVINRVTVRERDYYYHQYYYYGYGETKPRK